MRKIKTWIIRYLPSEIVGTIAAVIVGTLTYALTHNQITTAFASVWGENIGFYGSIISQDILKSLNAHNKHQLRYSFRLFVKDARNMLLEFGPSEILDSFVTRPFMMYIFPEIFQNVSFGIFIGKLAADGVFYAITIASYELTRKHLK